MLRFASFLYPWDNVEKDRREQLPEDMRAAMLTGGAVVTADAAVRRAASTSLWGLSQSPEGRTYLRTHGGCEVLRAWHLEEADEGTRQLIENTVSAIQCTEEELQA